MITGLHEGSFENLQLGSGMFLANFDPDTAADADELYGLIITALQEKRGTIGATNGGGTFKCVPKLRSLEADGLRGPTRGAMVNDGWTVKLTGTILEVTPDNFGLVLVSPTITRAPSMTTVEVRTDLADSDYLDRLCWVGDTARGYVLIELLGALNTNGAALTFRDHGEGTLPFSFQAHALSCEDQEQAPFRMVYFNGGEAE